MIRVNFELIEEQIISNLEFDLYYIKDYKKELQKNINILKENYQGMDADIIINNLLNKVVQINSVIEVIENFTKLLKNVLDAYLNNLKQVLTKLNNYNDNAAILLNDVLNSTLNIDVK